jgi:hypothetical protein
MCGSWLESSRAWFCSGRCRQKAYRRRKQGLPEEFGIARLPKGSISLRESYEGVQRRNLMESVPPPF